MGDDRKSAGDYSRESKGKDSSIDDQSRENLDAIDEHGWEHAGSYRDGVSASRFGSKQRGDYAQLLADVAARKLDIVVVWEVSRADRDLETWVPFVAQCRRTGVCIHVTSHDTTYDPTNRRQWRTLIDEGVDAADESEKISARALKGIRGAVQLGKAHGRAAYGLTRIYDPHDRRKFTQEPNEAAPVAREIIERVAANDPLVLIERDLNQRGVPPPAWAGIPTPLGWWRRNTIRNIARNPAYAGMRGHNGTIHPGNWDGIVSHETWQKAQAVLDDESRKTTAPGAFRWLLSYLAQGECGGHLHAVPARQARNPRYTCHRDGCVSIGVAELDECVTMLVLARLAQPDARAVFERGDEEAQAARDEVARLEAELKAARLSYARPGGISEEALAMKERALAPLVEDARGRTTATAASAAALALVSVAEAKQELRPRWAGLSVAARRSVIHAFIAEVTVGPADERLSRWSPDKHRLTLAAQRTTVRWRE